MDNFVKLLRYPICVGMDPVKLFNVNSSNVNPVKKPMEELKVPIRPIFVSEIAVIIFNWHTIPVQREVDPLQGLVGRSSRSEHIQPFIIELIGIFQELDRSQIAVSH